MKQTKTRQVQVLLAEIDRMRLAGWRWAEMYDWVRYQVGDPGLSAEAIRQLVSRARRRQSKQGLQGLEVSR